MVDRQFDAELRERMESLESVAALGYLVPAVMHEVNNPLSVMRLVADGGAPDPRAALKVLETLMQQVERTAGLVKQVQALAGRLLPERTPSDLGPLLRRFVAWCAWYRPDEPEPVLDRLDPGLWAEIHPDMFLQLCGFVASALRGRAGSASGLSVAGLVEEVRLTGAGDPTDRRYVRTFVVVRIQLGAPPAESLPVNALMAHFFESPRERHEVELMAAAEIARKASGHLKVSPQGHEGARVDILLPLRAAGTR